MEHCGPLYSFKRGVKYTKTEYDQADTESKRQFPSYCPDDAPFLCTIKSKSFGLCKKSERECCNASVAGGIIPINALDDTVVNQGKDYGYDGQRLGQWCGSIRKDYEGSWHKPEQIPANFKIMTYNAWGGICNRKSPEQVRLMEETIALRMKAICEEIRKADPDFVCLQEMTNFSVGVIDREIGKLYPYRSERTFDDRRIEKERDRTLENYFLSKHRPKTVKIYSIGGNMNYSNCIIAITFPNLIVLNCYMQAGSKYSPGQEPYWFHYSRCRRQQYTTLRHLVDQLQRNHFKYQKDHDKMRPTVPVLVVGDFNADLDGDSYNWPEIHELSKMGLSDIWTKLKQGEAGYTEDTEINLMRWNYKFMEKRLRYDGILHTPAPSLIALDVKIVGTKPIIVDKDLSDRMYEFMVRNTPDKESKVRFYDTANKLLALWPSDHFGVVATFVMCT